PAGRPAGASRRRRPGTRSRAPAKRAAMSWRGCPGAAERDRPTPLPPPYHMLACRMIRRLVLAALTPVLGASVLGAALLGTSAAPVRAQPAAPVRAVPDCTANVDLTADSGLKVSVVYRCRSSSPVSFNAANARAAAEVMAFTDATGQPVPRSGRAWRVAPVNGLAEAHYTVDLLAYAKDIDSPRMAVARGKGVLTL